MADEHPTFIVEAVPTPTPLADVKAALVTIGSLDSEEKLLQPYPEAVQSNPDPAVTTNWMTYLYPQLADRSFATMCLPRSHDSGAYELKDCFRLGSRSTVETQEKSIFWQILMGFRVFDIRPVIRRGEVYCGHYTYISRLPEWVENLCDRLHLGSVVRTFTGWYSGGIGATIDEVIRHVNDFLDQEDFNEAVILELSHAYDFDREEFNNPGKGDLSHQEWHNIMRKFMAIKKRFIHPTGPNRTPIKDVKFRDMINGRAAVIITVPKDVPLGEFAGQGFYSEAEFASLQDTSATYTQDTSDAVFAFLADKGLKYHPAVAIAVAASGSRYVREGAWSVLEQAAVVQAEKLPGIEQALSKDKFPNYITIDDAKTARVAWMIIRKLFS